MRAQVIGGIPGDLVGSLTGLTQGRFPVRAKATYAGALKKADRKTKGTNAAVTVESDKTPPQHRDLRQGRLARDRRQRRQGPQARRQQAPRPLHRDRAGRLRQHVHLRAPGERRQDLPEPEAPHRKKPTGHRRKRRGSAAAPKTEHEAKADAKAPKDAEGRRRRRSRAAAAARRPPRSASSPTRSARTPSPTAATPRSPRDAPSELASAGAPLGLNPKDFVAKRLVKGARVLGGTTLGRIGKTTATGPAPAVRDPPGRPRRPAHRPEADPRRLEAARVHRGLPRQGQERAVRLRRRASRRSARSC